MFWIQLWISDFRVVPQLWGFDVDKKIDVFGFNINIGVKAHLLM